MPELIIWVYVNGILRVFWPDGPRYSISWNFLMATDAEELEKYKLRVRYAGYGR